MMSKDYLNSESAKGKVINFDDSVERYKALIDKKMEEEDLLGALSYAFTYLGKDFSLDAISDVADIYADMCLYELSNKYWFMYLDRAPKDKKSVAYEELAINYFYMNNYVVSGYYFQKKMAVDGFIDRENIDQEIVDFFTKQLDVRKMYNVVYPENKIDYTPLITEAKRALSTGDFKSAVSILNKIPKNSPSYLTGATNLSMAYYVSGETDKAIDINRELIKDYGENVSVLCNLASMYNYKKDYDKSNYYYNRAVEIGSKDKEDIFKLATCSLEQNDHVKGVEYLEQVIDDKFMDTGILSLYGMALLNSGKYERAAEVFSKAYRVDRTDKVLKYYAELSNGFCQDKKDKDKLLPLSYIDNLPEKEISKRSKVIKSALKSRDKNFDLIKDKTLLEYVEWGLKKGGGSIAKNCIYLLTESNSKEGTEILKDAILDVETPSKIKEAIVFILVIDGYKGKIGLTSGNFYISFKPKKVLSEREGDDLFFSAYALALSKVVMTGEKELDKLALVQDEIYNKLKDSEFTKCFTREEFAALNVVLCRFNVFNKEKDIYSIFSVKEDRIKMLTELFVGEKND